MRTLVVTTALAMASLAALTLGCATAPPAPEVSGPVIDPNRPRIFLAPAEVRDVRGVAMGSAVSKGWQISTTSEQRFVAHRPLDRAAALPVDPAKGVPPGPQRVEVETDLLPRQGGVEVIVGASVVVAPGTKEELRRDYTDTYRSALMRSLDSLRAAWDAARPRLATATPPLPGTRAPTAAEPAPDGATREGEAPGMTAVASPPSTPVQSAWGSAPSATSAPPATKPATVAALPKAPAPGTFAASVSTTAPRAAPPSSTVAGAKPSTAASRTPTPARSAPSTATATSPRTSTATATPSRTGASTAPPVRPKTVASAPAASAVPAAASKPGSAAASKPGTTATAKTGTTTTVKPGTTTTAKSGTTAKNEMLVLRKPQSSTVGVWAYYAEHYARGRGCRLSPKGAQVVERQATYEVHRVYCEGGKTFLVRCNAGSCRGME